MVCKAAVEFHLLGWRQRRHGTTTNDAIPNSLYQFDLLVNVEHTRLLQELSVHGLDSVGWRWGNTSAQNSLSRTQAGHLNSLACSQAAPVPGTACTLFSYAVASSLAGLLATSGERIRKSKALKAALAPSPAAITICL